MLIACGQEALLTNPYWNYHNLMELDAKHQKHFSMMVNISYSMKKILILSFLIIGIIPLIHAVEDQSVTDSGKVEWRFCNGVKTLDYEIFNGTIHDTVHLKLQDTPECTSSNETEFQYQIFHKSNNQTNVTLTVSEDLEEEIIDVRVVGSGYFETFQFNSTHKFLEFSDFTHDKTGFVTIILDHK